MVSFPMGLDESGREFRKMKERVATLLEPMMVPGVIRARAGLCEAVRQVSAMGQRAGVGMPDIEGNNGFQEMW